MKKSNETKTYEIKVTKGKLRKRKKYPKSIFTSKDLGLLEWKVNIQEKDLKYMSKYWSRNKMWIIQNYIHINHEQLKPTFPATTKYLNSREFLTWQTRENQIKKGNTSKS